MRWPICSLADLCRIETGRTPPRARPELFGGGQRNAAKFLAG
jgi:hypothetical protein